jgi:K+-transporting ATPase KdpF subunit
MKTGVLLMVPKIFTGSLTLGYTIGGVLALLILGYLVYSLIKPEKF